MELKEMSIEELNERKSQIVVESEAEDANLDELETEMRSINDEIETRKADEAKRAEIRAAVASGEGETIQTFEVVNEEREKTMTNAEVRNSHEYNVAYANYIKTGNDTECRALLTENVSGTVPVAAYVEGRVRTAWDREGITSRVRKTFLKGNVKIGYVGAFNYSEVVSGYTSFYLGAKSVCPSVTMEVQFTGSWYDEMIYQAQDQWQTYGRYPDGGQHSSYLERPSIARPNMMMSYDYINENIDAGTVEDLDANGQTVLRLIFQPDGEGCVTLPGSGLEPMVLQPLFEDAA